MSDPFRVTVLGAVVSAFGDDEDRTQGRRTRTANIFCIYSGGSSVSFLAIVPSSLGVDASVKVEYRNLGKKASKAGVWYKSDVTTYSFLTTVKNTKNVPVTLVLVDQVGSAHQVRR